MSKINSNKKEVYAKGISHVLLNTLITSVMISAFVCSGVEVEKEEMINLIIWFIPILVVIFGMFYIGIECIISCFFKKK